MNDLTKITVEWSNGSKITYNVRDAEVSLRQSVENTKEGLSLGAKIILINGWLEGFFEGDTDER